MLGIPVIPLWIRVGAVVIAIASAFGYGHHQGSESQLKTCNQDKDRANAAAATELVKEFRAAATTTLQIANALRDVAVAMASTRERTRIIVREVSNAVDASPNLAVPMPDIVRVLRDEQYRASAAAEADARGIAQE